jgi:hypothetical protein
MFQTAGDFRGAPWDHPAQRWTHTENSDPARTADNQPANPSIIVTTPIQVAKLRNHD